MPLLQLLCIQGKTKHCRKYHHSPEQNLSFFELKIRQQNKEMLVLFFLLLLLLLLLLLINIIIIIIIVIIKKKKTILLALHVVHSRLLKLLFALFNSHEIINNK